MSLGPTSSSIMQPYGLPCALSTEKEVRSKTARKAAPAALEVNTEGVIQLDGIATRGMFMSCGPQTYQRQVTITGVGDTGITLEPRQLVDGILIVGNGETSFAAQLPTVLAVNAYLNSNLVSSAPAATISAATTSAPLTVFKLTVITNSRFDFNMPTLNPVPGHAAGVSGYQRLNFPPNGTDLSIVGSIPAGGTLPIVIQAVSGTPRIAVDVYFFQTAGSGTDPEWLILSNAS